MYVCICGYVFICLWFCIGDGWLGGWVDGWMEGWMDGCMDGLREGRIGGIMHGRKDGWMDGWMDGWRTDRRMQGWMDMHTGTLDEVSFQYEPTRICDASSFRGRQVSRYVEATTDSPGTCTRPWSSSKPSTSSTSRTLNPKPQNPQTLNPQKFRPQDPT